MKRFWEIDVVRGIAIVLMVIFNYSFALSYLTIYTIDGGFSYWYVFPRMVASMFILISGLSMTLACNQTKSKSEARKKIFLRGVKIFGLGMVITAATFLTFPDAFIIFGILSLIGFSMMFGQFFLRFGRLNLLLAILLVAAGIYLQNFRFDFPWLLWLGFVPSNFSTLDYFPVLPWFGVSVMGIYAGNILYKSSKRRFRIKDLSENVVVRFLSFLGRNSLIIYLLHQPILVLILLFLGFKVL